MFIALIGEDDYFKSKTCNSSAARALLMVKQKDNRFFRSTDFHSYNNISNTYPTGYRKSTVSSFTFDAKRWKRKQSMNIKLYLEDEKFNMLDQQHNE